MTIDFRPRGLNDHPKAGQPLSNRWLTARALEVGIVPEATFNSRFVILSAARGCLRANWPSVPQESAQ